jgi:glycosyltransferase involved in cell wall biosynthesis
MNLVTIPFTVFTPTFNRSELIARTYESLCKQTFLDFEWLIIDDGSTDDTSLRVQAWQRSSPFAIRYLHQRNSGKHRAHNVAVGQAAGELFAVLDSDDMLMPQAIERLLFHWNSIPESARQSFSGVTCLCNDQNGKPVGRAFPEPMLDCRHYELETVFGVTGEKWGCHLTSVLRRFEFPDIPGETYCPEGVVWNRVARSYLVRHVNEPLRIYHRHRGSLTFHPVGTLMKSPRYARLFYRECLDLEAPSAWHFKRAVNYVRYSLHAGVLPWKAVADSAAPVRTALMAPAGVGYYACDILRHTDVPASQARIHGRIVNDRGSS